MKIISFFSIAMILFVWSCKSNSKPEEEEENKEKICSFVNVEDIDKTIPFIDEFLAGLSNDLDDEQKLQALAVWLKSQPCIDDVLVLCQSCAETNPPTSEILVWFETQKLVLDILMDNPLKATGYHDFTPSPSLNNVSVSSCLNNPGTSLKSEIDLSEYIKFTAINRQTLQIEQRKYFNCCPDSIVVRMLSDENEIVVDIHEYLGLYICNCVCPVLLKYNVSGLHENTTYFFTFTMYRHRFIMEKEVIGSYEYYTTNITFSSNLIQTIVLKP